MKKLDPKIKKRIDAIQRVRARNNVLWMSIVRLAHRVAPKEAQAISDKINKNDMKILELNGMLTSRARARPSSRR